MAGAERTRTAEPPLDRVAPLPARAGSEELKLLDRVLDAWLAVRVQVHRARARGALSVASYKAHLAAVRRVEDLLEPLRRARGAQSSRAYELVTTDEQLEIELEAHQ